MQLKQQEIMLKQQESQRAHDLKQQEMVLKQQGEQRTHELEMLKLKLDSKKSRPMGTLGSPSRRRHQYVIIRVSSMGL